MKVIKVKILDVTLEAALLNQKVAKKFDEGLKRVPQIARESQNCQSGSEAIGMQCQAVIDFVDEIFGEGSAKKVFGEETDLLTCLDAWEEITEMYETQVNPLIRKYDEQAKERLAQEKDADA